jgi:glycosyltransferase domain-containing protein
MSGTDAQITILLPLKGRHLHTLRFMYHLNRTNFPYPLIIADGEVHPDVAALLEEQATFPNLSYQFIRYPNDTTYTQFYRKMADANRRVQTPYVMLADNDDFPCAAGIERAVAFLNANPDYSSCGGRVAGFELLSSANPDLPPQLTGPLARLEIEYSSAYAPADLQQDDVGRRSLEGYRNSVTTYYHVFRTPVLDTLHRELNELDFSDLTIHEAYFLLRSLTFGKARTDGKIVSYLRQHGTSTAHDHKVDWATHLLRSRFNDDFNAMLKRLLAEIGGAAGEDSNRVADEIFGAYAERLRRDLRGYYYTPHPYIVAAKKMLSPIMRGRDALKTLPAKTNASRHAKRLCAAVLVPLKSSGADPAYLQRFRDELHEIAATLTGEAFAGFLRARAPTLLSD